MNDTTWNVAPGGPWQARLCPKGRAHVIGEGVADLNQNPDPMRRDAAVGSELYQLLAVGKPPPWYRPAPLPAWVRPRPWHPGPAGFDRACRVAWLHERMVRRAKAVQA